MAYLPEMDYMNPEELRSCATRLVKSAGLTSVWELGIRKQHKYINLGYHSGTSLTRASVWRSLANCQTDIVFPVRVYSHEKMRIYLREQDHYTTSGRHLSLVNESPLRVKSEAMYHYLHLLPKDDWYRAEFVCPFCGHLCCKQKDECDHIVISRGIICERIRGEQAVLVKLYQELRELNYICELPHAFIPGVRVKMPYWGREWQFTSCVYIESRKNLPALEQFMKACKHKHMGK